MKKDKIKKNKKKVKFSFKRMLVYIATYLVCTVSVASLYVLSNSNSYSSNSPILFEEEEPSTLGLLVNNLMTLKDATVDINANVKKGDDELNVNIAGDVVIYEGFSNVDIDLTGTITYNQNLYTANIVYKDATMFISLNNQTYSFKASKLTEALGVVLTLVGMGDMQDLTGAFDMSMISSLEDKISEQALDNGVKLLFAITDDIQLEILTDNNYNLKSVDFANYEYNDYLINASVNLPKTNSDVLIKTPQNYKDITPAFDLLSSVINTAKFGGANFELTYDNYAVNGSINFKNQTLALKTNIQNNDIELYFKDNVVYLNTKQLKLKANISDIYDVIKQYLPDVNQNQALVMAVGAIEQLLNTDYVKSLDFSSITKQNDVVSIDLNSTKLHIDVKNNTINKIDVYYNQYNASVTLNYALTDLVVPNFEYINVFDLENLVEPIKQVVNAKSFSGTLNIDIDGVKNIFDVEINYNPLIVVVKGNVLNANIKVRYQDEYVYLSFNNSNLKFHINTFSEIFEFISNQNLSTAEFNQLGTVLNTVEKYLRLIINNNNYTFIYDDVTASIEINQNNLLNVLVNYQNYFVGLNINQINNQIEKVVECDFQLVEITCEDLKEFVENVTKNKYNLLTKITLNNKTYELDIKLSFENGLLLNLATTIDGYNLNAVIENKDVYINFDGIKITGNISQLPEILKQVESEFNNKNISTLSTPNQPQDALNQVISLLNDINVNELISVIDLSCIDFIKDTFTINVNDNTVIKLQLNNNNISSLQLKIDNNLAVIENIKVTDQNCAKPLTKEEAESYKCNVTYLADLVTALNNSFKNNGITLTSTLNINGHLAYITTSIDKNQDIVANVTVEYKDIKLNVIYKNDDLYITLNNNIKVKTSVNDVETLKDLLITLLELNGAELEENADKIAEELTNQVENIVQNTKLTDYVKNIENTLGQTTIYLAGDVKLVVLNSNNLITGVNVYYKDNSLVNTLSYSSKINLPTITESEYVSAVNFIEKVNNTKDVLMGKFSGVITLNYNGEQVSVNYACDNTNGFKLLVYTTVLDKQLNIQFENNTIYVSYNQAKLMFEVNEFDELLNWINCTFGTDISMPNIDFSLTNEQIYGLMIYALNNLSLTENQIEIGYENISATLTMLDYLSNIKVSYADNYVDVSIKQDNLMTLPEINVAEYTDWTQTADVIKNLYNLINQNKFNFSVSVTDAKNVYNLFVELDIKQELVKVNTNIEGYNLYLVLQGNCIYVDFDGLKIKADINDIQNVVNQLKAEFENKNINTLSYSNQSESDILNSILSLLKNIDFKNVLNEIKISYFDIVNNTLILTTSNQIKVQVIFENNNISKLILQVKENIVEVGVLPVGQNCAKPLTKEEAESYKCNVTYLADLVTALNNSFKNNGITLTSTLNINGHLAYITTSIDKNQDIVANVTVEYKDIKLNVIYKNDDLYITLNNNIKVKTSVNDVETLKDLLITLLELNGAELEENADKIAEELTNQVENIVQNTKLTDYVKNIENTLGQTTIYLAGDVKLVVLNSNNLITGVNVYYKDNSLVNTLSYSSKINLPTITESEYVSAVNFIEKVNNTKDVLMGKFSGVITLNYNGEQVSVNYACDNTNGFKLLVYTTVLDKQLNIQFENNTIFFSYDEYKLMFEVGDFNEFINFINSTFGLDIKIPKINTKLTDSEIYGLVVYVLNNLNLTESQIKIGYENANATLTMSDYLSNINIAYNNDYINVSINKNNELTLPKIIVAEYKDWTHTADIIKHIYNLVKQDKFNLNVAVTYDKQTYNANVEIDLNANVVKVSTNVSGYDLIIVLQDNTIYINFGGLKVYDSVENTISSVQYLMQMFDIDLSDTAGVLDKFNDINILDVIGSLTLYSFSEGNGYVSLSIADVLDLKTALNIAGEQLLDLTIWHNDLGVNKLDITTEIITANVQLLTANKNIALSSQEITAYVTKLTDLVSYVERLYDSYENVKTSTGYAISGDIAVRYSNLQLNGKLNLSIINEKLYAHISSTAFGVDTNIYLVDKDIYVDVAGLKIKLKLSEADINYIINWVNTTFEQDIKFEFDGQMLDLKTPDLQNIGFNLQENNFGLTLSEYLLGGNLNTSFKEMLLNLIFDEGLLTTIDISTNVLDDNTFVYEQGYADNAFDFESEISKTRNLVLRLNNLAFGNGVNTQVWGFDKGILSTLNNSALSEFNDYTNVLDIVEFAFDYYKQGNINLTADLTVNEKTGETTTRPVAQLTNGRIYSTLQLDDNYSPTSGTLYAGGNIIEYDYEKNTSITHTAALYFDNNYLYANYTHNNKVFNGGTNDVNEKSLNVKMQKDSIREILSLALHVLNIDLGTFAETLGIPSCDLNVENLRYMLGIKENNSGQIVSSIDTLLSNIENIIAIINNVNLTVNGNTSKLSLGLKNNGQVINFEVVFVGGELSYISANNITVNETQTIDLKVSAVSMSDVPTYNTSTDHIDLTNISSLLKAFINTSALNDYHIKGKVALSVLSIEAAELDVDVKVKLVNRKPVVAVELGSYPLISGVNNVNTNGTGGLGILSPMRYRKISIYIQDGYAYLRTLDEEYSSLTNNYDEYERATKIKASTLGGQIEYYLQYLLGFTDSVQTSINQAIEAGRNRQYPINICNIINSFTFEENWYNISVNLSELAYSNDIGTMNLYLQTVNNESTNNLDYLYKLGLDVDMLSLLKLKTEKDSENILKLVDIGVEQDFSSVFNYMADYSFGADVEVQRSGSNALGVVNTTSTTVNYISGTEYVADQTVSGAVGSDITGPAVTTYQVDDGKKVEYYAVSGWYLDKELTVPFTETKYSRFVNHTVYAKWELVDVKHYYTYTIHYNNGNNDVTLKVLEGQNIKLDDLSQYVEDDNVIKVTHNFKGWYLDSNFNTKFEFTTMPSYSFNVYAKWQTVTEYYRTISFETQFGNAPSAIHKLEEQSIALPTLQDYEVNNDGEVTLYTHIGWSLNADGSQIYQTTTMPTSDLTLYAVWQIKDHYTVKSVNFYKNGEFVATNTYRVGSVITPPAGFEYNENSLWYTDKEFNNLFETGLSVMPNYNIDLYVRNRYTITIVSTYGTVENNTISYYQGDTINIPAISSYYTDDYGNVKVVYTFLGYDNPTVMPSNNITVNALWKVENYYYVKLDTEQRYIFNLCAGKYGYSSNPTLATTYLEPVLEGTKISVADYQPTCSAYRTAFKSGAYNYKCSGWSTSVPSNYSNGGGSFDFTITKPTTLYVCWQKV